MTKYTRTARGLGIALVSAFLLSASATPGAAADPMPSGSFSIKYDNASLLFGFHTGAGVMALSDGSEYAISLDGYSIGGLGISNAIASGKVYNLRKPVDINGEYTASGASFTVIRGSGTAYLENRANEVILEFKSVQSGLRFGLGAGFFTVRLGKLLKAPALPPVVKSDPPPIRMVKKTPPPAVNNPVRYAMEFGFDKSRVSLAIGRYLDSVVADWRGKPVTFRVVGHADMVGRKAYNRKLSQARADAVRNALLRRGIPASKIVATGAGQSDLAVSTPRGRRLRANRRVVIMIEQAK